MRFMRGSGDVDLDLAVATAVDIAGRCEEGGRHEAYEMLHEGLQRLSDEEIERLGLELRTSVRHGDRALLTDALLEQIREALCRDGSELHALGQSGMDVTAPALIGTITYTLSLSPAALGIAVAVAGIILCEGLYTFCRWSPPGDAAII